MLCDSKVKAGMQTTHLGESLGRPQQKSVRKERIRKKKHLQTSVHWQILAHGTTFLTVLVERRHGKGGETGPVLEGNVRDS